MKKNLGISVKKNLILKKNKCVFQIGKAKYLDTNFVTYFLKKNNSQDHLKFKAFKLIILFKNFID